jgi:hypothetical protein
VFVARVRPELEHEKRARLGEAIERNEATGFLSSLQQRATVEFPGVKR